MEPRRVAQSHQTAALASHHPQSTPSHRRRLPSPRFALPAHYLFDLMPLPPCMPFFQVSQVVGCRKTEQVPDVG
ncbi:hypothetical protein ACP4OV_001894 [Aristida adscensionis]